MARGQGLVPEKRTDKRGVTVTRWVRPTSGATPSRVVPPPAVAVQETPEDPMDRPRPLAFERVGYSALGAALDRQFGEDDGTDDVEVTDRVWYEAKRAGLADMQLRAFLRTGFTDVPAMVEYAKGVRDREFSRRNLPGIAKHRAEWVRALMDAGISRETFALADDNLGARVSLESQLAERDSVADPVDLVRVCAAPKVTSSRLAVVGMMHRIPGITYEHVAALGETQLARYSDMMEIHGERGVTAADFVAAALHERKRHSPLRAPKPPPLDPRLDAVRMFGLDRALQLREPFLIAPRRVLTNPDSVVDRLPADAKFEYALFLDAVLDASLRDGTATGPRSRVLGIDGSPEYGHLGAVRRAHVPDKEEAYLYFAAGLTPEQTAAALDQGMSAQAAAGMHHEGIGAPVADGWL